MIEELGTEQLITRGKESYAHGEYAAALADLREVVSRKPQFADIHHLIGLCLSLVGRPEGGVPGGAGADGDQNAPEHECFVCERARRPSC